MAFQRNIRIKDLGKFEKALSRKLPGTMKKVLLTTAREGVALLRKNTRSVGAVSSGKLLRGWRILRTTRGVSFTIENEQDYALFVERGRRAGARRPPRAAIELWVKKKLGLSGKEAKGAAFVIARAIGRRGIRGRFIAFRSMQPIIRGYRARITTAYSKLLNSTIK